MIKADREALADLLDGMSPEDWDVMSLCDEWTTKGVSTHLLVTPTVSKGKIFTSFLKAGFNLDKMSARYVDQMTAELSGDDIAAQTRATAGVQSAPPGLKPSGVLNEVLIHGNDIARPLGRTLDIPVEHYVAGLDHLKGVNPVFKAKDRIAGLHLKATDAEWETGEGPSVEGPALSLLLAMANRRAAYDDLSGEGVETMRSR